MDWEVTLILLKSKFKFKFLTKHFSYGFTLTDKNKFDSLKLRVVVGTAPEGKIENPLELLPTKSMFSEE